MCFQSLKSIKERKPLTQAGHTPKTHPQDTPQQEVFNILINKKLHTSGPTPQKR